MRAVVAEWPYIFVFRAFSARLIDAYAQVSHPERPGSSSNLVVEHFGAVGGDRFLDHFIRVDGVEEVDL
jgi:hypothetical protein